jgi:hypothetical protein
LEDVLLMLDYKDLGKAFSELTPAEFQAKMDGFQKTLTGLFSESKRLETEIFHNFAKLKFE